MKNWINRFHARLDAWGEKLCEKEIRIPVDLTVGILFFLFALAILFVMPQQVIVSEKDVVNGRAFPTLLMVVMMICCGMLIVKELYKLFTKQPPQLEGDQPPDRAESIGYPDHSGYHLSAVPLHRLVCGGRCVLLSGLFGLFPLQKALLLCDHHHLGCGHLGVLPFRPECGILEGG